MRVQIEPCSPDQEGVACNNRTPVMNSMDSMCRSQLLSSTSMSAKRRKAIRMREAEITDAGVPPAVLAYGDTAAPQNAVVSSNGGEQHLTTKQQLEELRRTFGQENWLHSQAGDQVRQLLGWGEETTQPLISEEGFLTLTVDSQGSTDTEVVNVDDKDRAESIEVLESRSSVAGDPADDDEASDHVFVVEREVDDGQWQRMLTISPWILCEKDVLSGLTLSSWKMTQLKSVQVLERQPEHVRLQFNFVPASQSNRLRIYIMEENDFDVSNCLDLECKFFFVFVSKLCLKK